MEETDGTHSVIVDDLLRVMTDSADDEAHKSVYAIGDVATLASNALPPVGAVADQQARYLARALNARAAGQTFDEPFEFKETTKVSYLGSKNSVSQKGDSGSETGCAVLAPTRASRDPSADEEHGHSGGRATRVRCRPRTGSDWRATGC